MAKLVSDLASVSLPNHWNFFWNNLAFNYPSVNYIDWLDENDAKGAGNGQAYFNSCLSVIALWIQVESNAIFEHLKNWEWPSLFQLLLECHYALNTSWIKCNIWTFKKLEVRKQWKELKRDPVEKVTNKK